MCIATSILSSGCATLRVDVYQTPGTDVSQARTYGWASAEQLPAGDPGVDNSPYFLERLQTEIHDGLWARGYRRARSGTPDLLVHYHVGVTDCLRISGPDEWQNYCLDCRPPYTLEPGTVIIDVVDSRTRRLIWRGWVQGSLEGDLNNRARMEKKIASTVDRILSKLPRSSPQGRSSSY
jgi:hypothetical protein